MPFIHGYDADVEVIFSPLLGPVLWRRINEQAGISNNNTARLREHVYALIRVAHVPCIGMRIIRENCFNQQVSRCVVQRPSMADHYFT